MVHKATKRKRAAVSHADAEELAGIFEQMMQQLTLLGHTLPTSATSLTPQQLKILFTLNFLGQPTSMSNLSAKLGVTPGTLTRVASGLVRESYLDRQRSIDDDRIVKLSLTRKGRAMVEHIKDYRRNFFADICSRVSLSERRTLIESHRYILETYGRILQEKRGSASAASSSARGGGKLNLSGQTK